MNRALKEDQLKSGQHFNRTIKGIRRATGRKEKKKRAASVDRSAERALEKKDKAATWIDFR